MTSINLYIKFFGSFRRFGDGIEFSVREGSSIAEIKKILQERLEGEKLVFDSVLANENEILKDDSILQGNTKLSILPPVCGG